MKLKNVKIKNFRSITDIKIDLEKQMYVLLGVNESGKSNILSAISTISEQTTNMVNKRIPLLDEENTDSGFVIYEFENIDTASKEFKKSIKKFCNKLDASLLTTKSGNTNLTLEDIMYDYVLGSISIKIDILSLEQTIEYHRKPIHFNDYFLKERWFTLERATRLVENGPLYPENSLIFLSKPVLSQNVRRVDLDDVRNTLESIIYDYINQNIPNIVKWTHNSEEKIITTVNINEFLKNPKGFKHLYNIFTSHFKGNDFIQIIINAREEGRTGLRQLFNTVSSEVNHLIKRTFGTNLKLEIWPDGESINLSINENGNFYDISYRSDGFKRYLSFMLDIALTRKNKSDKTIILLDEPDTNLHPAAIRELRNQLIDLSKTNKIITATHSIHMIKTDESQSHIIVERNNDKTTIKTTRESNYFEEEILFNALTYSVFEIVKYKNIITEGWYDRKLITTALKSKKIDIDINEIGLCHSRGCKTIQNIASIIDLAKRKYIILSDSDIPAKKFQKEFNKNNPEGIWLCYDNVIPEIKMSTAEDFISEEKIRLSVKKIASKFNADLQMFSKTDFTTNVLENIKNSYEQATQDPDLSKDFISNIKSDLFINLQPDDINPLYYEYLAKVSDILKSIK